MTDLVLPTFRMDCRDWLVIEPAQAGLPDEVAGAPLLAMLSTVLLEQGQFRSVSGVLTVGLLDAALPRQVPVAPGSVAQRIVDADEDHRARCFLVSAPGSRLAMLAEFAMPAVPDAALEQRVDALMASFRWT